MSILGAHESISGGFHSAVYQGARVGAQCVQFFSKNSNQWHASTITEESVEKFQHALHETGISHTLIHDSYLINMASPNKALRMRSVDAFTEELHRAELLGVPYVVTHPGSYTSGTEQEGLDNIIRSLETVLNRTRGAHVMCLLETTAGQGTNLGWKFSHLAEIIHGVEGDDWRSVNHTQMLGICLDTCHCFAAGYDFRTQIGYDQMMLELDKEVGLERLRAFHLNDSVKDCGSRVDRHEHIGRGFLGTQPFYFLLHDTRFNTIPMYLETPKGELDGEDWDVVNLRVLRNLESQVTGAS